MKNTFKIFFTTIIVSILFFTMSCHSQSSATTIQKTLIPVNTQIFPTATNIQTSPELGDYLVDKDGNKFLVLLKSISPIIAGVMHEGYYDPGKQTFGKKGDPCLVLPFQVASEISKEQYLDISAQGYDSNDNLVSYCLNSGPVFGSTVIDMKPDSVNEGNFFLSPSKDLVKVKIVVIGLSDMVPP